MARPVKTKIDYFPIDCCDDNRMKLVELKHGLVAYAVYVKLLQKIYGNKGYYMNWDEDVMLLFSGEYNIPVDSIDPIIKDMLNRGIFHKELFEKYGILTSPEIQEQYLFVIAKRKNKELDERFRLINSEETAVNSEKTVVNSVDNTHSIVEDSIVKDSISEDRRADRRGGYHPPVAEPAPVGEMNNVILTEEEYEKLKAKYPDIDTLIDKLSLYIASVGKSYSSHYATLLRWIEDEKTKQPPPKSESHSNSSYDIDEFYRLALSQDLRSCLT
ncbi:MAG: DUF4373 domain-containing protein [Clostridia bacterium]|nr:DUF4373 domain-containing protein [Clostridia bacterium]